VADWNSFDAHMQTLQPEAFEKAILSQAQQLLQVRLPVSPEKLALF